MKGSSQQRSVRKQNHHDDDDDFQVLRIICFPITVIFYEIPFIQQSCLLRDNMLYRDAL